MIYQLLNNNNNLFEYIHNVLDNTKFIEFINVFQTNYVTIKDVRNLIKFIPVYEYLLSRVMNNNCSGNIIFDIYCHYFLINFKNNFNTFVENYVQEMYELQNEEYRNIFASNIIELLIDTSNTKPTNYIFNKFIGMYFYEICKNIKYSNFINICNILPEYNNLFIKSDDISSDIKFGSSDISLENKVDRIVTILYSINGMIDYTPLDIEMYKINNGMVLIEVLTRIISENILINFNKIFDINDSFIEIFNIKKLYIDKIIDKTLNTHNFKLFLKLYPKIYNTGDINTIIDLDIIKNIINADSALLLRNLIENNILNITIVEDILNHSYIDLGLEGEKEILTFYKKIITNYSYNEQIIKYILTKYLNLNISISDIYYLDDNLKDFSEYIRDITLNCKETIINLIKFFVKENIKPCAQLISTYQTTFIETNLITLNYKFNILSKLNDLISYRIPNILINSIKKSDVFNTSTLYCIVIICEKYNISIPEILLNEYPEMVHSLTKLTTDNIIQIENCIYDYDKFLRIIKFPKKSDLVFNILLNKLKQDDIHLYLELLINFESDLEQSDIKLILKNISNNTNLLKYVINNQKLVELIFDNNYHNICMLLNHNNNYSLSMFDKDTIIKYLDNYKLSDLLQLNKQGIVRLFSFLNERDIIKKLIKLFGLENLNKYYDNFGFNIYNKMLTFGIFDDIPESYIIENKNIINIITKIKTSIVDKLLSNQNSDTLDNILKCKDNEGNSICYYLAVYHNKIFKELMNTKKINSTHLCSNYNSETFLMKLIKHSQEFNLDPFIKWIINNCTIDQNDYFVDNNYGSILTYCLKYNKLLIKHFLTYDIINCCINVYDTYKMICPYSDFAKSGILKMNLIQIACIVDHDILNQILKLNKKQSFFLIKETIQSGNIDYNLLHIALFNNPESVQVLLGTNIFDRKFLKDTEDVIGGFEKVIDIQPASWYYLQQSLHNKYELKLNINDHWYGYNYKNKLSNDNIKNITHYILDKQELGNTTNTCNICETYSRKVVFTKCRHKVCITCAVHSDKCGNCRTNINENDKILI